MVELIATNIKVNNMLTVIPAYGRDYNSKAEALKDWEDNKDFIIQGIHHHGKPVNKRDAESVGEHVKIRYKNKTRVVIPRDEK